MIQLCGQGLFPTAISPGDGKAWLDLPEYMKKEFNSYADGVVAFTQNTIVLQGPFKCHVVCRLSESCLLLSKATFFVKIYVSFIHLPVEGSQPQLDRSQGHVWGQSPMR